jgi:hypothetical protein
MLDADDEKVTLSRIPRSSYTRWATQDFVGKLSPERPDAAAWITWYTWARLLTSKSILDV